MRRNAGILALVCAAALTARHAAADTKEASDPPVISGFRALDRPTGMAEAGFGWLTLPGADVCSSGGCKAGDTSFELDAWQLYRQNLRLAFGAGLLLGLIPTTDAPQRDSMGIERDHSRKYLTLEGTLRYYPYVGEKTEVWVGLTGGLVVVSDRFKVVDAYDKPLIGPSGVVIRTEGGTLGVSLGGAYELSQNWSVGGSFRFGNWFLPTDSCPPIQRRIRSKTRRQSPGATRCFRSASTSPTAFRFEP
jgi:hypothetical protein